MGSLIFDEHVPLQDLSLGWKARHDDCDDLLSRDWIF